MMRKCLFLLLTLILISQLGYGQTNDAKFRKIYKKFMRPEKFVGITFTNPKKDSTTLSEMVDLLSYLNEFQREEKLLNGKAGFGFVGNQSESRDFYRISSAFQVDHGLYPFELDLSTKFQTSIRDGVFEENISDIDMSLDFHYPGVGDGLLLENFIFLKRWSNDYINVQQRYEMGGGLIINWFSDKLTSKGIENRDSLAKKPKFNTNGDDVIKCYEDFCSECSGLDPLDTSDYKVIRTTREWYQIANKKKYSQFRLALLMGVYYEIEKVKFDQNLTIANVDSMVTFDFGATSFLRWEIRPTFVWRPNDAFSLKLYPYFKLPIGRDWRNTVELESQNLIDERSDYFLDFNVYMSNKITDNFSFSFSYKYVYDGSPNRRYFEVTPNDYLLIVNDQYHHFFDIRLNAEF